MKSAVTLGEQVGIVINGGLVDQARDGIDRLGAESRQPGLDLLTLGFRQQPEFGAIAAARGGQAPQESLVGTEPFGRQVDLRWRVGHIQDRLLVHLDAQLTQLFAG